MLIFCHVKSEIPNETIFFSLYILPKFLIIQTCFIFILAFLF